MIDSGATGNFISESYLGKKGLGIPYYRKKYPTSLYLIDGTPILSGRVERSTAELSMQFGTTDSTLRHIETIQFDVIPMNYSVILGYTWLQKHLPTIDWSTGAIEFTSISCKNTCLRNRTDYPITYLPAYKSTINTVTSEATPLKGIAYTPINSREVNRETLRPLRTAPRNSTV